MQEQVDPILSDPFDPIGSTEKVKMCIFEFFENHTFDWKRDRPGIYLWHLVIEEVDF